MMMRSVCTRPPRLVSSLKQQTYSSQVNMLLNSYTLSWFLVNHTLLLKKYSLMLCATNINCIIWFDLTGILVVIYAGWVQKTFLKILAIPTIIKI